MIRNFAAIDFETANEELSSVCSIEDFRPSLYQLPKSNRWVMLGDNLPWEAIEKLYNY